MVAREDDCESKLCCHTLNIAVTTTKIHPMVFAIIHSTFSFIASVIEPQFKVLLIVFMAHKTGCQDGGWNRAHDVPHEVRSPG